MINASSKHYTVLAIMLTSLLGPFMGSAVNLAIPSIGSQFESPVSLLSWVITSYILSSVAFVIPCARLADIHGRKSVFLWGMLTFSVASVLCGLSWSIEVLVFFRFIQGIGGAMLFATGLAMLIAVSSPEERGRVLGIYIAVVYAGLSIGPVLGGLLNYNLGWESIFYVSAMIGLITVLITLLGIRGEWKGCAGEPYDLAGALLYIVSISGLVYGISSLSITIYAWFIVASSLVLLVIFIYFQLRTASPIFDLSLFTRSRNFSFANLASLVNYSATFALVFVLSIYLQIILGFNSQAAGIILLAQPVTMALLSPFAGHLSDRIDARLLSSWGMGITAIGLFVYAFLSQASPLWLIIGNLILLGVGFALFASPNSNVIMGSVDKRYYNTASSTLSTMRLIGQAISMAIVSLIMTGLVGNVKLSPAHSAEILESIRLLFIIFTALSLMGIFFSWPRKDPTP